MCKRFVLSLLVLVFGLMAMTGCMSKTDLAHEDFVPQAATPVEWNFIVYLDADNNLEQYGVGDFNEMEMVGSNSNINILVLMDRIDGYDRTNGNWTGTRLYKVTKDTNTKTMYSTLIKDYGELDMADPNTLKNFIVDCQTLYPANRTVLTLWNHGDGLWPRNEGKAICWDDTTGTTAWDCLTNLEVLNAMQQARAITGKKIDILNMDACLMQTMEVSYEWRTEIDYLVGSEETISGYGNNYDGILANLAANPFQSTLDYAKYLVTDYYNTYKTTNATLSVIDMGTPYNSLITAFTNFASAMYNTTDLAAVTTARNGAIFFTYDEYRDLYAFATGIENYSSDANARSAATALKSAITNAIPLHRESGTFAGKAFGMAILLPTGTQWNGYKGATQYPSFPLSQSTLWDEFVQRYTVYTGGTI